MDVLSSSAMMMEPPTATGDGSNDAPDEGVAESESEVEVLPPDTIEAAEPDSTAGAGPLTPDEIDPFGESRSKRAPLPANVALVPASMDSDAMLAADPLTAYLAQLRHFEPLPAEQQQDLAERYLEDGDVQAAKMLILSNVRLVVKIAREYRRSRESLMEVIQEGNVGLAEAIRRYDPYRGVKFTSYAQYWIRAMILNYLMNSVQPVRIGSTRAGRKLFFNLHREREKLLQETQSVPSTHLLADRLGVPETELVNVMRVIDAPPLSIDAPAPGYEKTNLGAVLSDDEAISPEDRVVEADLRQTLHAALSDFGRTLTDNREMTIWTDRVLAESPKSLQELGNQFGVSRERIRQIEVKIKRRVEAYLKERFGAAEIELAVRDL